MNKRLLLSLYDRSGLGAYMPVDLKGHELEVEEHMEKFAELIVRECVNKIESKRSSGENTDQWTITRDMCYHDMMKELKEHFGVEE